MHCSYCGTRIKDETTCPNCGAAVTKETLSNTSKFQNDSNGVYSDKSKAIVVIVGIVFGYLGIHNFYLGYKSKAITQLLLSTIGTIIIVGPIIASIWSFIEVVMYAISSDKTDAEGKVLKW